MTVLSEKFHWRMLAHFHLGDSIVGKGKVIKKYVENDEHIANILSCSKELKFFRKYLLTI